MQLSIAKSITDPARFGILGLPEKIMVFNFPWNFPNFMEDNEQMIDSNSCFTHLKIQACFALSLRVITTETTKENGAGHKGPCMITSFPFVLEVLWDETWTNRKLQTQRIFCTLNECSSPCEVKNCPKVNFPDQFDFSFCISSLWCDQNTPTCTQTLQNIITDPTGITSNIFIKFTFFHLYMKESETSGGRWANDRFRSSYSADWKLSVGSKMSLNGSEN